MDDVRVDQFTGILDISWAPDGSRILFISMGYISLLHPTDSQGRTFGGAYGIDLSSGSIRMLGTYNTFEIDLGAGGVRSAGVYPTVERTTAWSHDRNTIAVYEPDSFSNVALSDEWKQDCSVVRVRSPRGCGAGRARRLRPSGRARRRQRRARSGSLRRRGLPAWFLSPPRIATANRRRITSSP